MYKHKSGARRKFKAEAGVQFAMLTRDLFKSPAWRLMSISCKRLIDFLCEEHFSKAGNENGQLLATYDQLAAAGISRRLINRTINEAEALGLVNVERGGRKGCVNDASIFELTFLHTYKDGQPIKPNDRWKKITREEVHEWQQALKIKIALRSCTATVPQSTSSQLH